MTEDAGRPTIAACIVCRNEADKLQPCLDSVRWADELLLLDLESEDGSGELARGAGARVLTHAPVPIVEVVRNVVADAAGSDWILALDPDERVSAGLARELRRAATRADIDAVVMPRMNFDFGYPASSPLQRYEPQLRMYRRAAVRWPTFPNALPAVPEARLLRLPARDELTLAHDRNRNIPEAIDRVRRYAPAQAQAMIDAGEVFSARRMLTTLGEKLYRHFVLSRALRDGVPGLVRAGLLVAFHLYVWAAFWHLSGGGRRPADDRLLAGLDLALSPLRLIGRVRGGLRR
ncbi:MAG TPA: glycosyltransferase [Thermoleophilaceae bacterium]|nr:glycosyltransferase [Thermoleophilaceae bacterium]